MAIGYTSQICGHAITGKKTPIGLYLVKEIVHGADGEITVDSKPGKRSSFIVYLKLA